MKITMLGTGNALVTKCYNTCFVISEGNEHLLVDAGGGNQILVNLEKIGLSWKNIHSIFVTHKHIDHILGIIWMMRIIAQNMKKGTYEGDLVIYAHDEVISILMEMTHLLLQKSQTEYIGKRIFLVEVKDGEERETLGGKITFFDIHSTKAKQFGFSLVKNGKKITCLGDEPYMDAEEVYARNADYLMSEAFCLYEERDVFHPYEKNHSTVKDAAELATKLNVRNLILYHTEDKNIRNRKELYTKEAKEYFSQNVIVPEDLEVIEIQ